LEDAVDGPPALDSLPVTILTGFLGSGKTTLLRRALSDPGLADTAIVINEVGEIAIDHYLVDIVEGGVVELPGGCLCCAVREDLARTLRALIERRDAGDVRPFGRVVVETSGLADPAPILYTLGADPMLDQRLRLGRVVTIIDAVTGAATLARFAEAARQAAIADALVISKTDLAPFGDALAAHLAALNPAAERIVGTADNPPEEVLFSGSSPAPRVRGTMRSMVEAAELAGPGRLASQATSAASGGASHEGPHAAHTHGLATFTLVLQAPATELQFAIALGRLASDRGYDLLRVKGILGFADRPEHPAIVQAAQHTMFTPEWLDGWPDADRRNRLVFIVHEMAPEEILDRFAFAAPTLATPPLAVAAAHPLHR
jgi:G3E family GTPase